MIKVELKNEMACFDNEGTDERLSSCSWTSVSDKIQSISGMSDSHTRSICPQKPEIRTIYPVLRVPLRKTNCPGSQLVHGSRSRASQRTSHQFELGKKLVLSVRRHFWVSTQQGKQIWGQQAPGCDIDHVIIDGTENYINMRRRNRQVFFYMRKPKGKGVYTYAELNQLCIQ